MSSSVTCSERWREGRGEEGGEGKGKERRGSFGSSTQCTELRTRGGEHSGYQEMECAANESRKQGQLNPPQIMSLRVFQRMWRSWGCVQRLGAYLRDRLVIETVPLSVGERPAVTEQTLKLHMIIT